ncbi:MAG TPA: NAD(P)H-hydrate dehydratase, partial [Candidatus Krumholzibacterium sp.]|nr:NAD(P)H-hydrate dehydratase [Candidatus Krumholzibacterium sp.]
MRVVTSEEMRRLDEETILRHEPGLVLMERAGQGIFEVIMGLMEEDEEYGVSIFLGRGNNAGDGLVLARLLAGAGVRVVLHYLHGSEEFSPDAFKNFKRLDDLRDSGTVEEIFFNVGDWEARSTRGLEESDLVVDALLGTGINSPVRDVYVRAIEMINGCGLPVVAIDIPSGVNGTTGEVMGCSVRAGLTVTMALPKTGELFYPGKALCGSVEVVDIGIPDEVIESSGIDRYIIGIETALEDLPSPDPSSHKFDRGSLLVVAGSRRYSGAAVLSSISALRSGCGIVYLAVPESIRLAVQAAVPEVIVVAMPETEQGSISAGGDALLEGLRIDAMAIGPGLTTDDGAAGLVRRLVSAAEVPVLLDADGINAFAGAFEEIVRLSGDRAIVLSPHSGELARLTGQRISGLPLPRMESLSALVAGTGLTLVHKGAPTVIAHPSGRIDINSAGHPGLATAGSGDVLTGVIGSLLAQTKDPARSARLGVYLHSRAADYAAMDTGERGMTASDCSRAVP